MDLADFTVQKLSELPSGGAPYPSSTTITGVSFDWGTHVRKAPGSDNWASTWAADGNLYSAWGDGGGFGGTNRDGRSGIGVARVEGSGTGYSGFNVFGGNNPEGSDLLGGYSDPNDYYRGTFNDEIRAHGKSMAIASVDGTLYMWASPRSSGLIDGTVAVFIETRLARSTDNGKNWDLEEWNIPGDGGPDPNVVYPGVLQFGQDYSGAPTHAAGYVYLYFIGLKDASTLGPQRPGEIHLARVPANDADIRDPAAYEWYSSTDTTPSWSSTASDRKPVFKDANGVGWTNSVHYNAGLQRYILTTEHQAILEGNIGMFESTRPWGPWKTITYQDRWRGAPSGVAGSQAFYWNTPTKWISGDGKAFTLGFTGVSQDDSWNTVRGSFTTETPPPGGVVSDLVVNDSANAADWSARTDLRVGDAQYGDRVYGFASVPARVAGAEWVRTANDSKRFTDSPVATFTVTRDAVVYVAHNDAVTAKPSWLSGWSDTGADLVNDESPRRTFSLFSKTFAAGAAVSLGPNGHTSHGMYTVAVKNRGV